MDNTAINNPRSVLTYTFVAYDSSLCYRQCAHDARRTAIVVVIIKRSFFFVAIVRYAPFGGWLVGGTCPPMAAGPRCSNRPHRRGIILHGTEAIDSSSCKGRAASLGRCSMEPRDRYMAGTCAASVSTGSSHGKVGGGAVPQRTWRPELQFPDFAVKR